MVFSAKLSCRPANFNLQRNVVQFVTILGFAHYSWFSFVTDVYSGGGDGRGGPCGGGNSDESYIVEKSGGSGRSCGNELPTDQ